ncbi:MAG: protease modulator HflC [Methyloceanibacter sp.]|uniref:protease modulator HflC n=1 Tax=Methyloceanibacter sp. TaxID=1965321 RepID=UPI003D9AE519
MSRALLSAVLLVFGLAAVAAYLTLFTVEQTQQALVLQFGSPKRLITEPGLQYKVPFVQNVEYFDKRLLDLDSSPQEVIASDQKRLIVDAFARWRITDPLLFYQAAGSEEVARSRLGAILEASLRRVLGSSNFEAVVRDKRQGLMKDITAQVDREAKALGVTVVDVRIKRADLPEANSLAIFRRMQTERQRQAAEIRAQGEEASRRIRATADRQVTVLKAEATGESERLRGTGDAERNRVFAEVFTRDPDFFAFYRSMQAYEASMKAGDTRFLLSPDSQFFQYFNNSSGVAPQGSNATGAQPAPAPETPEGAGEGSPAPAADAASSTPPASVGSPVVPATPPAQ